MNKYRKNKIVGSLIWKLMENGATQGIQFVISIILARLLLPDDYGIIAIIIIFIRIANIFVQTSFNTALIQKKNADQLDFSSTFYFSIGVAVVLYWLLFLIAPWLSRFYNTPELVGVLRWLATTLILGAVFSIQTAYVARNMQFSKLFVSSLCAVICSGIVGILLAYFGYGVWALVVQSIAFNIIAIFVLAILIKWRPSLNFSIKRIKGLISFGWKILATNLIDTLYTNIYGLIIGKEYNTKTLGYYNRGKQFPEIIVVNISSAIQSVMFPALSSEQDNIARVKEMVRRSASTSSYIIFPMMIGLAAVAEPLVRVLLTDKWLPCVPYLQILCISYASWPIITGNPQGINAIGRSDVMLKLEIFKKVIGVIILVVAIPLGIYAMLLGILASNAISVVINAISLRKHLHYGFREQLKDLLPQWILSIVMGAAVYTISFIGLVAWQTLLLQVVAGVGIYVLMSILFRLKCFTYLLTTVKEMTSRSREKSVSQ